MGKYIIGIDVGGTNIKAGVLKETGETIKSYSIKALADNGSKDVLNRINELVVAMLAENGIAKEDVIGIGMGLPGPVNTDTGVVNFCPNMVGWENLPAAQILKDLTGIDVKIGNDANVITLGEAWLGAAKGYKDIIGITLGTGIGGGIIINGKILSGHTGAAAEVGHMKIVNNGNLCGCGHYGCWEAYASATGLIRETVHRLKVNKNNMIWKEVGDDINRLEAKHIFDAAKAGDAFALDLVEYEIEYVTMGLANLLNILNPEIVVIGGGVALAGDILFDGIRERLHSKAMKVCHENALIVPAKLGNDAGVVGAAALFINI